MNNDYTTEYSYTNGNYMDLLISNCTFYFKDITKVEDCYGGGNIVNTKNNVEINSKGVGVYNGEYSWK